MERKKQLANYRKKTLIEKGFTQTEFAREIGITENWLSIILRGAEKPGIKLRKLIALKLGVSENDFWEVGPV